MTQEQKESRPLPQAAPQKSPAGGAGSPAAYACILSAAVLWGIIGLFNRHLMAGGFSPSPLWWCGISAGFFC